MLITYPATLHACTGEVSPEARQLCEVTRKALEEAIKICGPGVPYNKIGKVRLF